MPEGGVVAVLALSVLYVWLGETRVVSAFFAGLAPAVIAIVVQAVYRVAKRSLIHPVLVGLALAAFLALTVLAVPFLIGFSVPAWSAGSPAAGSRPSASRVVRMRAPRACRR